MTHDEAAAFLSAVTHQLGVANAALFPLFVSPAEKLDAVFHDALKVLFTRLGGNSGQVNLIKSTKVKSSV